MFRIRAWIRAFFGFSRRETNAFLLLLPLMIIILFSEPVYRNWLMTDTIDFSVDERKLDSLILTLEFAPTDSAPKNSFEKVTPSFVTFDPNTVSAEQFIQLGLPRYIAERIVRFRNKGGRFRKKEDLLKMYEIDSAWYEKAVPWISIVSSDTPDKAVAFKKYEKTAAAKEFVDVNLADTVQLMKVYGVGPGLSRRICLFRDRLGGFVSIDQLHEVYGLDSAVINRLANKFFVADGFSPQKINLNLVGPEQILHPYFRKKEALAIAAYRRQHGDITSIEQLSEIKSLSAEWIEKVKPYISFD